jgi:hypothetical protein
LDQFREMFSPSPHCPDQLWGTFHLLFNGLWEGALFLWAKPPGHEADHSDDVVLINYALRKL